MLGSRILSTANPDRPAGFSFEQDPPVVRYTLPRPALAGNTFGPDLITTPGAFQTTSSDGACCQKGNGFVVKIASAAPVIALSTAGQVEPFAVESIVSVYGANLASVTDSATTVPLPTSLDGNTVTVTDSTGAA